MNDIPRHPRHHIHVTYFVIFAPIIAIIILGILVWTILQFQDNWNLSHSIPVGQEAPLPASNPFGDYKQATASSLSLTPTLTIINQ